MCDGFIDPRCIPGQILESASETVLDTIAAQLGEFVTTLIKSVVAGWLTIPSPQVASSVGAALHGQTIGAVAQLRAHTWWITAALAVGSLLFAAARIAINRNGREAAEVTRGMVQLVILSGLGVPVVLLLTQIGDIYTNWIINRAAGGQFEQRITLLTAASAPAAATPLPRIAIIICGLILTITLLVQIMLMFGRAVALVILTGALPALAAAGMAGGRATQSRDKAVAWLVAFVIYKPVAGTVYAVGFWLIGEGTSLNDLLAGMMTFLIALVALPALMRLISPAVDRLSAGAGSGAMEGLAVGAAVATGAASVGAALAGARRSGGGGGGGGAEAATGAAAVGTSAAPAAGLATEAVEQVGKRTQQVVQAPQKVATVIGQTGATGAGDGGGGR